MIEPLPDSGPPPWASADFSYASWVPTILGHLSFSMMALRSSWPARECINEHSATLNARVVATHEERIAQDFPYSDWLVRLLQPSAVQHYFLFARTCEARIPFVEKDIIRAFKDEQGALIGEVVIVPSDKAQRRSKLIEELTFEMGNWRGNSAEYLEHAFSKINQSEPSGVLLVRLKFCLFRTGELRLWYDKENLNSQIRDLGAKNFEAMARQTYYFIKDAAHHHYHHERDSDQLIELVALSRPTTATVHRTNELCWKREVLWGFARVIAQLRRNNELRSLKRVLGFLAYADAFQSNVAIVQRPTHLDKDFEFDKDLTTYDFAHAKSSVGALDSFRSWYNSGSFQLLAAAVALFFSTLSLWAAATRIVAADCVADRPCPSKLPTTHMNLIAYFVGNPIIATILVICSVLIFYFVFIRDVKAFRLTKKADRFLRNGSSAVGASVAALSGNVYFGYVASITIYVAIFLIEILVALAALG